MHSGADDSAASSKTVLVAAALAAAVQVSHCGIGSSSDSSKRFKKNPSAECVKQTQELVGDSGAATSSDCQAEATHVQSPGKVSQSAIKHCGQMLLLLQGSLHEVPSGDVYSVSHRSAHM